jgi:hypothetical protein
MITSPNSTDYYTYTNPQILTILSSQYADIVKGYSWNNNLPPDPEPPTPDPPTPDQNGTLNSFNMTGTNGTIDNSSALNETSLPYNNS